MKIASHRKLPYWIEYPLVHPGCACSLVAAGLAAWTGGRAVRRRSGWIWGGRIAALVVLAGLAVYLASVGLDKADKLASILGLLVAVAALVMPYLAPFSDQSHPEPGRVQQVASTIVGGHLTQVRKAKGVRVQGSVASGPPQATPPSQDPAPGGQSGQYVNGVWVGGNLTQVDGVDGDITIG